MKELVVSNLINCERIWKVVWLLFSSSYLAAKVWKLQVRENWKRRKNCVNHWINFDWGLFIRLHNSTFVRALIAKFYTVQFWLLPSCQPKIWRTIPKKVGNWLPVSSVTHFSDTCLIHWNTVIAVISFMSLNLMMWRAGLTPSSLIPTPMEPEPGV